MGVVITRDDIIAYAEVDYVIKHMNERYQDMVPVKLREFFETYKEPDYDIYVNPIEVEDDNISYEEAAAVTFTAAAEIGPHGYFIVHFNDGVTPNSTQHLIMTIYPLNNNIHKAMVKSI